MTVLGLVWNYGVVLAHFKFGLWTLLPVLYLFLSGVKTSRA
jgi:hypothetical protein